MLVFSSRCTSVSQHQMLWTLNSFCAMFMSLISKRLHNRVRGVIISLFNQFGHIYTLSTAWCTLRALFMWDECTAVFQFAHCWEVFFSLCPTGPNVNHLYTAVHNWCQDVKHVKSADNHDVENITVNHFSLLMRHISPQKIFLAINVYSHPHKQINCLPVLLRNKIKKTYVVSKNSLKQK